jgi:hypothetical protein
MGADLLIAICDAPAADPRTWSYSVEDIARAKAKVVAALDRLDADEYQELAEYFGMWDHDIEDEASRESEIRERVLSAADSVLNSPRDVVLANVHDHWIFIGGGTSWGDSPEGLTEVAALALVNPWGD